MAEQAPSETMAGETEPGGQAALNRDAPAHPTFHGRPTSWVTAVLIIVGFVVGGVALTIGPSWVTFWIGAGIVVVAVLFGWATHIFDDWY